MSRKLFHRFTVFNALAANTSQIGLSTSTIGADRLAYHIKFTNSVTGTFDIQAKNTDSDSWFSVPFNATMTITADTEALLLMNEVHFSEVRLVWNPSSATGTITANLILKSLGA